MGEETEGDGCPEDGVERDSGEEQEGVCEVFMAGAGRGAGGDGDERFGGGVFAPDVRDAGV